MKFIQVDPEEFPNFSETRRGRVSYPIIKQFMETGFIIAKMDRTGTNRSAASYIVLVNSYANTHLLPVKAIGRGGEVYLIRLDIDKNLQPIPNWQEKAFPKVAVDRNIVEGAQELTDDLIDARFTGAGSTPNV